MPRPRRLFSLLWAGAFIAAGCARHGGAHHAAGPPPSRTHPVDVALHVTNHHWLDVTVSVEYDGQRTRVGSVTAATSAEFVLPLRLFGVSREFRLVGEAIGSPEVVRTETLTIQPGQFIEWTLEHDLRRSSVGVF